jgi:hypothetical protein
MQKSSGLYAEQNRKEKELNYTEKVVLLTESTGVVDWASFIYTQSGSGG